MVNAPTALPIVQEAEWASGPVWTGAENIASAGFRSPDRPARSDSLYTLRYSGPHTKTYLPKLVRKISVKVFRVDHIGRQILEA